ncbi:MAG: hypothetical protein HOQ03_14390 [Thermoleophilia bacterium]|nr:hypothetical protein [Thermoleophilia bacterium]
MIPMGTGGGIALSLDIEMLGAKCNGEHANTEEMPDRPGTEVYAELGGRHLLYYVHDAKRGALRRDGRIDRCWVTPTAFSPEEASWYLHLPDPESMRRYVLFVKPEKLTRIRGPKRVRLGGGVEYFLPDGFRADAVEVGWEVAVR